MNTRLGNYLSLAAYISGAMGILGFVSIMLFFGLEAPQVTPNSQDFHFWGTVSDISGPLTMLPLLVVMLGLHRMERDRTPVLSSAAFGVGVIGALGVTILSVLLVARVLTFEQQVGPVVFASALVGIWLIAANYMGRMQQIIPSRPAWLGIAVGISQALYPVLLQILGGADFYANIGSNYILLTISSLIFLVSYIGFPVWTIWLGRVWSRQRAGARAGVAYAG